ncbi:hypothetical protein EYF80_031284 [Liparis tanakae]|uniref:Uncharacterized protein n=1 Tax=Liparis tanakae TaxID=230148 RepID=A0A4Z2GYW0_9TELE|nr:hypothetical protein EYF80_031284 [Liparis tanakae]
MKEFVVRRWEREMKGEREMASLSDISPLFPLPSHPAAFPRSAHTMVIAVLTTQRHLVLVTEGAQRSGNQVSAGSVGRDGGSGGGGPAGGLFELFSADVGR